MESKRLLFLRGSIQPEGYDELFPTFWGKKIQGTFWKMFWSFFDLTSCKWSCNPEKSRVTAWKINMEPKNHLFEKGKSSSKPPLLCSMLIFGGVDLRFQGTCFQ